MTDIINNTPEYKILKYLSENDNGKFIDISTLFENKSLIKQRAAELKKQDFIAIKPTTRISITGMSNYTAKTYCKIKPLRNKFLFDIDSQNNNPITNNFNNSQVGQLAQDSSFSNSLTTINTTPSYHNESDKKPIISRFLNAISENKLITGTILLILAAIIKSNRIIALINYLIDSI